MRKKIKYVFMLCLLPMPAMADGNAGAGGWQKLSGAEITRALTARILGYGVHIRQDFKASGRTLYDAGRPSWGYWRVQGDQYCSQWPPLDNWSCYQVYRAKDRLSLKFVGAGSNISVGRYID